MIHRMYWKIQGDRGPGIQGDPGGCRGIQRYTEGYREIHRDGIKMDTKWYSGDTWGDT